MEKMDQKKAIALLRKHSKDNKSFRNVLAHSKAVQKAALRIAKRINGADRKFIRAASLLHDIGRLSCKPGTKKSIRHGIIGAAILRKEGFPRFARVAERHIGVGITRSDIMKQRLDLPLKDYVPRTVEEKIIAYADNLIFGSKEKKLEDVVNRFRKELGEDYAKRVLKLDDELKKLQKRHKRAS